jgi:hypothetical protein
LLRRGWSRLLLFLLLFQLIVDLLRGFDSVGRLLRGGAGIRSGGLGWRGCRRGCLFRRGSRGGLLGASERLLGGGIFWRASAPPSTELRGEVGVVAFGFTGGVWVGGGDAAVARGEDEFLNAMLRAFKQEDVASGAVEELSEDGLCGARAVGAVDAFVADSAGDLHPGEAGDVAEDVVERGVLGGDGELVGGEVDAGAIGRLGGGGGLGCCRLTGRGKLRWLRGGKRGRRGGVLDRWRRGWGLGGGSGAEESRGEHHGEGCSRGARE